MSNSGPTESLHAHNIYTSTIRDELRQDYRYVVARFAIDPPTLLQLADESRSVHPSHRLVAPNSIRSEALDLLLQRVRSGALAEKAALELHERITGVKIRLLGDRVSRRTAWQIARDQRLEHNRRGRVPRRGDASSRRADHGEYGSGCQGNGHRSARLIH